MKRKFLVFPLVIFFLMFSLVPYVAQAETCKKAKGHEKGIGTKIFCKKAKFILNNQDELGLSDKQVKQIKDLRSTTKRELIKRDAEIALATFDIKEKLHKDKVDVTGTNPLIDKKHELKKAKEKYGSFKNVLLTEKEIKSLSERFGEKYKELIENLSIAIASKGYKYKSHYATILNWARNNPNNGNQGSKNNQSCHSCLYWHENNPKGQSCPTEKDKCTSFLPFNGAK